MRKMPCFIICPGRSGDFEDRRPGCGTQTVHRLRPAANDVDSQFQIVALGGVLHHGERHVDHVDVDVERTSMNPSLGFVCPIGPMASRTSARSASATVYVQKRFHRVVPSRCRWGPGRLDEHIERPGRVF